MKRLCVCSRFFAAGGLFAAGLVVGLLVPRGLDTPNHVSAQEQPAAVPEERLSQLKLKLPAPTKEDGSPWVGQLGKDIDVKQGRAAARGVGLHILRTVREELGSLNKVARLVKTLGMVNAAADFKDHPAVVNGFSDLMVEVFGAKAGKGTRSAVGMSSLPGGIAVEIEAIFEVRR